LYWSITYYFNFLLLGSGVFYCGQGHPYLLAFVSIGILDINVKRLASRNIVGVADLQALKKVFAQFT